MGKSVWNLLEHFTTFKAFPLHSTVKTIRFFFFFIFLIHKNSQFSKKQMEFIKFFEAFLSWIHTVKKKTFMFCFFFCCLQNVFWTKNFVHINARFSGHLECTLDQNKVSRKHYLQEDYRWIWELRQVRKKLNSKLKAQYCCR